MELRSLLRDAQDRLDRFAEGDAAAVTDAGARELVGRLEALVDSESQAGLAAGLLVVCRYDSSEDFLDVTDLDRALTLFAQLAHQALPEPFGRIFAASIRSDLEDAVPGAACHPAQLHIVAVDMREDLAMDYSDNDVRILRLGAGLTQLALQYCPSGGEMVASTLALHGEALQHLIGADRAADLVPELVAVYRLAAERVRPGEDELFTKIQRDLGLALLLQYSTEGEEEDLIEARSLLGDDLPGGTDLAFWLREYVEEDRFPSGFDYKHAAFVWSTGSLFHRAGIPIPEGFWDLAPIPTAPEDIFPSGTIIIPSGIHEYPVEGGEPLRVANINIEEVTADQIKADLTALPRRDRAGRAVLLAELADRYRMRFIRLRTREFLDHACALSAKAVRICPKRDPRRAKCLAALFRCLLIRYDVDGDPADLDKVISSVRDLLALRSLTNTQARARHLADLSSYLLFRHQLGRGRRDDLDQAHAAAWQAVALAAEGSDLALLAKANLGMVVIVRYEAGYLDADLDTAIDLLGEGTRLPETDENYANMQNNLSTALTMRYGTGSGVADLDAAVEAGRAAWRADRAQLWSRLHEIYRELGTALGLRYRELGALSDLNDAIELAREALESLAPTHPFRSVARADLAGHLAERARRTGSADELAEAIQQARTALADASDALFTDHARHTLADVLASPTGAPKDIVRFREAVALRRDMTPTPRVRAELARLLHVLSLNDDDPALSQEAEDLLRQALNSTRDRAELHLELGTVLYERAHRDGNHWTLHESACFFRAAALDSSAPPFQRVDAARRWGATLADDENWTSAVEAYALAIDLLPQLAPRALARADQEHILSRAADLASDACAAAIQAGDPATAVRLFEAGRGVLWARLTETKTELQVLAETAPHLAERYRRISSGLDEPYAWQGPDVDTAGALAERRRLLAAQWQDLVSEIRALPGYHGASTLASPHPGVGGPVILLAVSRHGSHALILHQDDTIVPVPLPALTPRTAGEASDRIRAALLLLQDPKAGLSARIGAEAEITAVLDLLAETVTAPVLAMLDPGDPGTRVWWVPSGALTSLPLHAAGDTLTRVRSSFSPTLSALRVSAGPGPSGPSRLLVVALPETPGAPPLSQAVAEADMLRRIPGTVALTGQDATREAVLTALPDCEVAHFACHTIDDADGTRLLLHDHRTAPLTLLDVAGLHLPQARLAYLSACSTLMSGRGLADEAVHLAAAFQHAGFPEVIGTLWPVDDAAALTMARALYADPLLAEPSRALHAATLDLAAAHPLTPSWWACHVHVGV